MNSVYTGNAGQVCVAGSRILIHRSVWDDLLARIERIAGDLVLADPLDLATTMGPIVSAEQFERVTSYLDIAEKEGAELVFGGRTGAEVVPGLPGGYWVSPTLYTADATTRCAICQEEIFGPVAVAIPFEEDEEALTIANDSPTAWPPGCGRVTWAAPTGSYAIWRAARCG